MSTHSARESGRELRPKNPLRAVFMGTPHFAVPALDTLASNPAVDVVAVYTPPDRRRGRGRVMEPSPVKARAQELEIPIHQPPSFRSPDVVDELSELNPEIIVVVAYGRLLPAEVLDIPRFGCLNLHPSLLPRHRGPSPVPGAILSGDDTTGVTLMLLDEGMDSGPIIAQRTRSIGPVDDAESLTTELFRDGAALLEATLRDWVSGNVEARPQDDEQATFTSKMERADGLADWGRSAEFLWRQQRAYTPWPGLHTAWQGKELKLLEVAPLPDGDAEPGVVVRADGGQLAAGTGEGRLEIRRLQLEGRRPADAAEFVRGYPDFPGARLG
ncbi:MAG: methionyl-tRNA formyltransferase [Chloroflexota bacterium]|nr:methionyl-tRNA formyltransferase [Chloroflexota bacterium]MDE2961539.1 methionyl-tRNA formyltransferase [Chloroflexota bacterium]